MGNTSLTSRWTYELEPNTTYFWSVQAIDGALTGGPFAPEQTFTTGAQSTQVRFVNLSAAPAASNLDIYLGATSGNANKRSRIQLVSETPLLDDLAFLNGSALVSIPADSTLSLLIAPGNSTGSADAFAQFDGLQFGSGQSYVVSIYGVSQPDQFAPNPEGRETAMELHTQNVSRDSVALDTNQVGIYFLHGVTDAPAVDVTITTFGMTPLPLGTFSFGETSDIIPMLAGETEILVTDPSSGQTLASYVRDLSNFTGSVVPALFSGFVDPAANQNGPGLAIAPIAMREIG